MTYPPLPIIRRSRSGKHAKIHVFELSYGDIGIEYIGFDGEKHKHGDPKFSFRWIASIPHLDPLRIQSVKLPTLDYGKSDVLYAEVRVLAIEGPEDIPEKLRPFWKRETI